MQVERSNLISDISYINFINIFFMKIELGLEALCIYLFKSNI